MNVTELLLEYYKPGRNERGHVVGSIKDWMKMFGASEEDVQAGLKMIFDDSDLMHRIQAADLKVLDKPKAAKNGTIKLEVMRPFFHKWSGKKGSERRLIDVHANGKIDINYPSTNRYQAGGGEYYHRSQIGVMPKPRIVVGKPIDTIYKTLKQALEDVIKRSHKWVKQADEEYGKAMEAKLNKPVKEAIEPKTRGWYLTRLKADRTTEYVQGPMDEERVDDEITKRGKGYGKAFISDEAIRKAKERATTAV